MQRLTQRTAGMITYVGKHTKLLGVECAASMRVAATRDVMQRLADYEDTGLTPEEIAEISRHYADAAVQVAQYVVENAPQIVQSVIDAIHSLTPEQIMLIFHDYLQKNQGGNKNDY